MRCARSHAGTPTGGARPAPPSPFPEGWYFVASRTALRRAGLIGKTWLGQEIVAWCNGAQDVCVAAAYSPHTGVYLGPRGGGRVHAGCLVCPSHGLRYDVTGNCVAPSGMWPPPARLRVLPTLEVAGMIFGWWSPVGRPPDWQPPPLEQDGRWDRVRFRSFRLPTHPEFTTESAVDLNHLAYVHGYREVRALGPVTVNGAHLRSTVAFKRALWGVGRWRAQALVEVVVNLHGLGYSYVDIYEGSADARARFWVLATPIDGTLTEIVLATQVRELRRPRRVFVGLRVLPVGLRTRLYGAIFTRSQAKDVRHDLPIWSRKCHVPQQMLNRRDGEIMMFRRFCRQFYPT